jgi:hypothetical protein
MAEIGQFIFCNVPCIVIYLLCFYYFFLTGIKRGATVTQLTIMVYKSMTYVVALVCHYSRQRKALFCFLENKMSKNSTILRGLAW